MNWKEFWNKQGRSEDPFVQVSRIGGQTEQGKVLLGKTAAHIAELLQLNPDDVLLDACCGNGLLTAALAPYCKKVVGLDFSESLVKQASTHFPELEFHVADMLDSDFVNRLSPGITKVNLYFSFQYFVSVEQGKQVVSHLLKTLPPGGKLLLGDVPDMSKLFKFYDSPKKMLQLLYKMLRDRNDMGKFWSEEELLFICNELNVKGQKLKQPKHLPYAHYRMDFLIDKKH